MSNRAQRRAMMRSETQHSKRLEAEYKPFREYYERNSHKEFFDMTLADRVNETNALVRIKLG